MVERVAKAIEASDQETYGNIARAAIAAMREPTEAMLEVGEDATWEPSSDRPYIGYYSLKFAWDAMIDEALAEK
jgi:hypothetical protein